jgi:hypothetical protein
MRLWYSNFWKYSYTGLGGRFLRKTGKLNRMVQPQKLQCPRQELNLRTWFRRPVLYPLSYGDSAQIIAQSSI